MRNFIDRTLKDQKEEKNIRNAVITMVFFAIMDRALKILIYTMSKNFYGLNLSFFHKERHTAIFWPNSSWRVRSGQKN